ncbi:MAG TPA: acyl-CoA dehydrogenase family protein [Acidimicrobiales bacterium]|nr:acyl-CoA dehydrogenase family protein [Acidimicrobiales bacterium]
MHFAFDDDQLALSGAVAGLLEKRAGLDTLRRAWAHPGAPAVWAVWDELAAMGVHGLLAPETAGGSDLDWVTMALVLAEAGRAALPLPLLETAAVGIPLVARAGDPLGILPSLVDGSAVLTVSGGTGPGSPVPASSRADWFLIDGALHHREEVDITPVRSVDRTRDTATVVARHAGCPVGDAGDAGALATAAVLIGLGRALVRMTVDYVKERRQFGVPVGSFQAVKHQLADATMQVEFAAPTVWSAAWEMSHPELVDADRTRRSVSLAKAAASTAAERVARTALQCHGAMGYTDDYHLHMWLKRVWCLAPSFGTARRHRIRLGRQLGLPVGCPQEERSA